MLHAFLRGLESRLGMFLFSTQAGATKMKEKLKIMSFLEESIGNQNQQLKRLKLIKTPKTK